MNPVPIDQPDPAFDFIAEAFDQAYHPGQRPFPREWEAHYLGVSKLVSLSAAAYAKRIIEQVIEEDALRGYNGWYGNTLGDKALSPLTPHRECRISVPHRLHPEWTLDGHMDGIKDRSLRVFVLEHKAYTFGANENTEEVSQRQAAAYLALGEEQVRQGRSHFPLAEFQEDPTAKPYDWPEGAKAYGISVWVAAKPGMGPERIDRAVTAEERKVMLDFLMQKADAIITAVKARDLAPAIAWDHGPVGLTEFHERWLDFMAAGLSDPLEVARLAIEEAEANDLYKSSSEARDKARSKLLSHLSAAGVEAIETPDAYIKLVGSFGGNRRPWPRVTLKGGKA